MFVKQLETELGLPIVWVEAVVDPKKGVGVRHRVVNFETAARDGSVFEAVIKKYTIPSNVAPNCSKYLKTYPIQSYAKSIGFKKYHTVIGYRADEPKRINLIKAKKFRQWYPLYEWNIRRSDVASYWMKQAFDLQLKDYEGNCKLCYKKSKRKLLTSIVEHPEDTVWIADMERKYSDRNGQVDLFFRGGESISELIEQSKEPFTKAVDQSKIIDKQMGFRFEFDFDLDEQDSCAESCEPFAVD